MRKKEKMRKIPMLLWTAAILLLSAGAIQAEVIKLTLDEAIDLAVKNNYEAKKARLTVQKAEAQKAQAQEIFYNEDIHFDFDQAVLSTTAQKILSRKATWLKNNRAVSVVIEGHCDERGTVEYNMALGDRRAKNSMDFLIDMGIESSRLSAVSYGEEAPLNPASNKAAWAQNRRVHLTVR